jgi:LysM repeat protein
VQPGDTLGAIADRYGISVLALQQANGLADSNVILVGQVLVIP